jgi:hypothetical protein
MIVSTVNFMLRLINFQGEKVRRVSLAVMATAWNRNQAVQSLINHCI